MGSSTAVINNGHRLVKRRRALLESNPPRNSQPETHRDGETGEGPPGPSSNSFLQRLDRFPHASKNSFRSLALFENGRRHVPQRGMQPLAVVYVLHEVSDGFPGVFQIAVLP